MLGEFGKTWHPAVDRDKKMLRSGPQRAESGSTGALGRQRRGVGWEEPPREGKGNLFPLANAREPETQNHSHQVLLCVCGRTPAGTTHVTLIWRMSSESFTRQESLASGSALWNNIGLGACSDSATFQKTDLDQVDSCC